MNIKQIFKRKEDYIQLLKERKIHIVVPAYIGLTKCSVYLEFGCGIKQHEQEIYVSQVNENKEAGTLFPRCPITLIPYRYETNAFMTFKPKDYTGGKGFSDEDFKQFITDILKSEIYYIKSGRMVIDFQGALTEKEKMRFFNLLHVQIKKPEYANYNGDIEFLWD
jgi:hypothetical protein